MEEEGSPIERERERETSGNGGGADTKIDSLTEATRLLRAMRYVTGFSDWTKHTPRRTIPT